MEITPEPGYGVHYRPGKKTLSSEAQIPCEYDKKLDAVVNLFGSSNVKQLELWATTYYVVNGLDGEQRDLDTAFRRIHQLKPHFTVGAIKIGYEQLRERMATMLG